MEDRSPAWLFPLACVVTAATALGAGYGAVKLTGWIPSPDVASTLQLGLVPLAVLVAGAFAWQVMQGFSRRRP